MGLLKHVIFPVLTVVYGHMAYKLLIANDRLAVAQESWGKTDDEPLTKVETHLAGALGGVMLMMAIGNIVGIVREDAHFRGIWLWMQLVFLTVDCVDAYVYETGGFAILAGICGVLAVAGMIHANEPGIFTNSKTSSSTKDKSK